MQRIKYYMEKVQLADEKYRLRTSELLALQTLINPLENLY
jgi:hypothetical protein